MSKNKLKKPVATKKKKAASSKQSGFLNNPLYWALAIAIFTGIVFFPMLSNSFTNWDDQFYITSNPMFQGRIYWDEVFTHPLMANFHPLTMMTLAMNYQVSQLSPFTYYLVNWLLHMANTALVFYLAYRLSKNNHWVGGITALFFGIHPMHVESVAWASERKDVLYTFFFLWSLLVYWKYIQQADLKKFFVVIILFALSLLSKPAAVVFPLVMLLMDAFAGRSLKESKVWLEKIPFFILSVLFGLLAIKFQHGAKAIEMAEGYPLWQKLVFSIFGFGEYVKRFFWPFPMSNIHPFPEKGIIPASYYVGFIIFAITLIAAWLYRKKNFVWFGIGFFAVNVVLVLQLLSFGHAIIAERYTYVPYIGIAFALSMAWANSQLSDGLKKGLLVLMLVICGAFSIATFQQTKVWKSSESLWSNAIKSYPRSALARANRGQYLAKNGKYDEALVDFEVALQVEPNDSFALINRASIYLNQQNYPAAYADADSLIKHTPWIPRGYYFRGVAGFQLKQPDQALIDLAHAVELDPRMDDAWGYKGVINYNYKQDYQSAFDDFSSAIEMNPKVGAYFKNRARCYVKFGKKNEALNDIATAQTLGENIDAGLLQAAQALP
jgi:tetratricopeptide (TPR) repeat protein